MQEISMQSVAKQILSLGDGEVADFIRDEVSHKRLSSKLCLLHSGLRDSSIDSRRMAREAIERLGFL